MTKAEQEAAAKKFAKAWCGKGYEKGQSQPFWLELLEKVYGVKDPYSYIRFEDKVHIDTNAGFIDGYIDSTHTMIEQKSVDKELSKPIKQSDGSLLTPFQQAKRYSMELPYSQRPRWIVTCNFAEFYIYDMEQPNGEPEIVKLKDLPKEYYRLNFLVNTKDDRVKKEEEISAQATEKIAALYNALYKNYNDPSNPHSLKSLNILCVRLVFCAYAEDAGLFGPRKAFENYIRSFEPDNCRKALIDLFKVLDTKPENRDPYDVKLNTFPYVNGGLFSDENIEIPLITKEIRDNIINEFCEFNWSQISPTVFGAMFESTLNPDSRRTGGMHYTSIENIHKVIDPLFLDDLNNELQQLLAQYKSSASDWRKNKKARTALLNFQNKLSSLTFFDPACGSGNFLTETYLCLRRLENKVLAALYDEQTVLAGAINNPIKVSINQFFGIEINDFAVSVAMTALWIAESQTLHETEMLLNKTFDYLPLKSNSNIHEGNALRIDWESIVPKNKLNYIMGNPPFSGARLMKSNQKDDMYSVFGKLKGIGNLDYVAAWYKKAAEYMDGSRIQAAFVSTNSISQGEQVAVLWKPLMDRYGIHINFAHRTFLWNSEAKEKAHVHCVIIGFSQGFNLNHKKIYYNNDIVHKAENINGYLIDAPNIFVESRNKPLWNVPTMVFGNSPIDDGNLIISAEELPLFLEKEPLAKKFIRPFIGAEEYINNKKRYCLWFVHANPDELRKMPLVMKRINAVKEMRLNSKREATRKRAEFPSLFGDIRQPEKVPFIIVPRVSSENRRYIPIGFMSPDNIVSDAVQIIPNASLYHFGVLTSNVHMAWMRIVAGRLKSDYRYSKNIVYNNFPWPSPDDAQIAKIEETAQGILDARALYPNSSLAALYDEVTMPPELRKAHRENDRAVLRAYGFPTSSKKMSEADCVAALMKLYQQKVTEIVKQNNHH